MSDWDNLSDILADGSLSDVPSDEPDAAKYLDYISGYIDSVADVLRPINLKIHDNPELNYKEFIAHETLVSFLKSRGGWKVTPSAYGIETAFIAEYDSGKKGPVVSFNAEYGLFKLTFASLYTYQIQIL